MVKGIRKVSSGRAFKPGIRLEHYQQDLLTNEYRPNAPWQRSMSDHRLDRHDY